MRKLLSIAIALLLFVSPAEAVLLFGDNSTQTSEDFTDPARSYGDTFTASAATGTYENVVIYVRWGTTGSASSIAAVYDSSDNLLATGAEDTDGVTDGVAESYAVTGNLNITNGATYRIATANDSGRKVRHDGTGGEYDQMASYATFPTDPFSSSGSAFGDINAWVEGDLVAAAEETATAKKVILVAVTG